MAKHDAIAERMRISRRLDAQVFAALLVEDQRRYHQLRVEPAARLVDGLCDVVRREARLEVLSALVRIAELREGHAAGIEPAVNDFRHAPVDTVLSRLAPGDFVDPGLVNHQMVGQGRIGSLGAVKVVEGRWVLGEDLGGRRGNCHRAGHIVNPDVEGGPPVALP